MITPAAADAFAAEWYAAWNAHDLDAILSHYVEDVEFFSPFVVALNDDPTGAVRGKDGLRAYFSRALAAYPDLRFEPLDVLAGVDSLTLYYISVERRHAAEVMTLNADGHVTRVVAHYRS